MTDREQLYEIAGRHVDDAAAASRRNRRNACCRASLSDRAGAARLLRAARARRRPGPSRQRPRGAGRLPKRQSATRRAGLR